MRKILLFKSRTGKMKNKRTYGRGTKDAEIEKCATLRFIVPEGTDCRGLWKKTWPPLSSPLSFSNGSPFPWLLKINPSVLTTLWFWDPSPSLVFVTLYRLVPGPALLLSRYVVFYLIWCRRIWGSALGTLIALAGFYWKITYLIVRSEIRFPILIKFPTYCGQRKPNLAKP